jgi:dTDP-glucose pyrophosphorylase
MDTLERGSMRIALIVDSSNHLLGTLTDGDVRRAILKGVSLTDPIKNHYNKKPITCSTEESLAKILDTALNHKIFQIPIVNEQGLLVGIEEVDEIIKPHPKDVPIVIMAGGEGTRLRPITEHIPKPLVEVGGKPILATILEQLKHHGFHNIYLCVNYKSQLIKDYFGNGKILGIDIHYIQEKKKLGTAGALSLLPHNISSPFIVMNGDILTNINFENLYSFHLQNQCDLTIATREHTTKIPFGVIHSDKNNISHIEEKPTLTHSISAGVYVIESSLICHIPKDEFFDMPSLINICLEHQHHVKSFSIQDYWIDIGRTEELQRADHDFGQVFQ